MFVQDFFTDDRFWSTAIFEYFPNIYFPVFTNIISIQCNDKINLRVYLANGKNWTFCAASMRGPSCESATRPSQTFFKSGVSFLGKFSCLEKLPRRKGPLLSNTGSTEGSGSGLNPAKGRSKKWWFQRPSVSKTDWECHEYLNSAPAYKKFKIHFLQALINMSMTPDHWRVLILILSSLIQIGWRIPLILWDQNRKLSIFQVRDFFTDLRHFFCCVVKMWVCFLWKCYLDFLYSVAS